MLLYAHYLTLVLIRTNVHTRLLLAIGNVLILRPEGIYFGNLVRKKGSAYLSRMKFERLILHSSLKKLCKYINYF